MREEAEEELLHPAWDGHTGAAVVEVEDNYRHTDGDGTQGHGGCQVHNYNRKKNILMHQLLVDLFSIQINIKARKNNYQK